MDNSECEKTQEIENTDSLSGQDTDTMSTDSDGIDDQKEDLIANVHDLFEELSLVLGKDFALTALKSVLAKAVASLGKKS